jgi:hypothetical protein
MKIDRDAIMFEALANRIAEKELAASLSEDRDRQFIGSLYRAYREAGSPHPAEDWVRDRLRASFVSAADAPRWVERRPIWPFLDGRPMSFVQQVEAPEFVMADGKLSSASTLYIFEASSPDPTSDGWTASFRVVQQFAGL